MRSILVLEDDITIADLVRAVLEDAGYRVDVATSAREIPTGEYACVLSDLMTVSAYRFEDARDWILRVGDRLPGVPIVVLTAHAEAARDGPALGARAIVTKPFDVETLTTAVREAIAP